MKIMNVGRNLTLGASALLSLGGSISVLAQTVTPTVFTSPSGVVNGGTIGFAYAGDKFVGSIQGDGTGILYQTNLNGGSVSVFAPGINVASGTSSSEHFVSSSLGLGGFPNRDIYVAAGSGGILHINHAGTASDMFVSGLASSVRGILFDSVGTFNHDMLVTTAGGQIYRVNSAGTASLLASIGADTEGLDVAPIGANFGVYDGQLIVASEGTGLLHAIDNLGNVSTLNPNSPISGGIEELSFVPLNLGSSGNPVEGFYGANYTPNVIKAGADQFLGGTFDYRGDVIVTGESDHQIKRVHWNGSIFDVTGVGFFPNQPEDGIFVTADIIRGGGTPEPGTMAMLGSIVVTGGLLIRRRKK